MRRPSASSGLRGSRRLIVVALLSALAMTPFAVTPLAGPAAAAPPYSLEERAAALASPALVFVDVGIEGYLRFRSNGALVDPDPAVVHSLCSGFVVTPDGNVVTTTHCLQSDPDSLRGAAAVTVTNAMIKAGKLAASKQNAFIDQLNRTADFTGAERGTPAQASSVTGQLFLASTGAPVATTISGRIVDAQVIYGGDVGLVRLDATGLPVAKLTPTTINPDAAVVMLGFNSSEPNADPATYTAQSRNAKIVGPYGGEPRSYRLDGDLGAASDGGMVVDTSGSVIAMITADPNNPDKTSNIAVDAGQIADALRKSGVNNALSTTDQTYRSALDAYFRGAYTDAIRQFDSVLAVQPNNLPAKTYRDQAIQRRAIEGDLPTNSTIWAIPVVASAIGLVLVMVVILLVMVVILIARRLRARERVLEQYGVPALGAPISGPSISTYPISGEPGPGGPLSSLWGPPASSEATAPPSASSPLAQPTAAEPTGGRAPMYVAPAYGAAAGMTFVGDPNEGPWHGPPVPGAMDYSGLYVPSRDAGPAAAEPPTSSTPLAPPPPVPDQPFTPPPPVLPEGSQAMQRELIDSWPSVTIWRPSDGDQPVPPFGPAPDLDSGPIEPPYPTQPPAAP
jgi:hypothetical protein